MIRERGWTKGSQKVNRFLFRLVNKSAACYDYRSWASFLHNPLLTIR